MINFENLTPVTNINTRVDYDMRYSTKTGKFNLSQKVYDKYNLAENGFNLVRDDKTLIFHVVPNEQATVHSGRKDKVKGKTFTAASIVNILGLTEDTEFDLVEHNHEGETYLVLSPKENEETNVSDEDTEEGTTELVNDYDKSSSF